MTLSKISTVYTVCNINFYYQEAEVLCPLQPEGHLPSETYQLPCCARLPAYLLCSLCNPWPARKSSEPLSWVYLKHTPSGFVSKYVEVKYEVSHRLEACTGVGTAGDMRGQGRSLQKPSWTWWGITQARGLGMPWSHERKKRWCKRRPAACRLHLCSKHLLVSGLCNLRRWALHPAVYTAYA